VTARVGEVRPQPLAQAARLPDVEQPPIRAEEVVDARAGRDLLQAGPRHVHDEGTPVDGGPLEVEELIDAVDAPFEDALEKYAEDLGGDLRVGQRPVPLEAGHPELGRDGIERAPAEVGEEPAGEAQRAHHGGVERASHQRLLRRVQVGEIEGGVVRHQHGVARKRQEAGEHGAHGRSVGHHCLRDPRQSADEGGNRVGRLDQAREAFEESSPGHAYRAELDDAVRARDTAGGLQVQHDEGGLAERLPEGVVDARPPAVGAAVEAKTRVAPEERGEQAAPELRVTPRRGEDQIEELGG